MARITFLIFLFLTLSCCPLKGKYFHRQHQTRIAQKCVQDPAPHSLLQNQSMKPKKDIMYYVFKYY